MVDTLDFAETHQYASLKNLVINFIVENRKEAMANPLIKASLRNFPDVMFEIVDAIEF